MRICVRKTDRRVIEMQSNATEGTLIKNAVAAGYKADDVEEKEVDAAGYAAALDEDPVEIAAAQRHKDREQAVEDARKKIVELESTIGKATDFAGLKAAMADMAGQIKIITGP